MEIIISTIVENFLVPALIVIAGAVMVLIQRVANNAVKCLEAKIEMNKNVSDADLRQKITETVAVYVKAAVANCMPIAEEFKKNGGKLTEEQIETLNTRVYDIVMSSLPLSFIEEGNILLETLGGKEVLDVIINNLMEQYVYEYKKTTTKTSDDAK